MYAQMQLIADQFSLFSNNQQIMLTATTNSTSKLKVPYWNCNGIVAKVNTLRLFVKEHQIDVMLLGKSISELVRHSDFQT